MAIQDQGIPVDRYARFTDYIRNLLLPETKGHPTPERLKQMLDAAVSDSEYQMPQKRLREVVYVVLNHPPLESQGNVRHFVAAMNWKNVHKVAGPTLQFLRKKSSATLKHERVPSCDLRFFPDSPPNDVKEAITQLWTKSWLDYWNNTLDGMTRNLYTWNQLLLQEGARPFPLGLCWDRRRSNKDVPYFHLTGDLAAQLNLPRPMSKEWLNGLITRIFEASEEHARSNGHLLALNPLREAFDKIYRTADRRTNESVAWAVSQLLTYYGIWGGSAFLSIPVLIGTPNVSRNAVFSICTLRPLSPLAVRDWQLMASALLRPLVEEEMDAVIQAMDYAQAAFHIGHFVKNRTMPVSNTLDALEGQIINGDSQHELANSVKRVQTCWRAVKHGSAMLDVHARAIRTGLKERSFLQQGKEWTAGSPYDVHSALLTFCARVQPLTSNQTISLTFDPNHSQIWIEPWIKMADGQHCRPADTFYDGVLEEMLINAAQHSNVNTILEVQVRCNNIEHENQPKTSLALVLSNICATPEGCDELQLKPRHWHLWTWAGPGGLPHFARFLNCTNLSQGLFVRIDPESDIVRFSVAIPFSGLNSAPALLPKRQTNLENEEVPHGRTV